MGCRRIVVRINVYAEEVTGDVVGVIKRVEDTEYHGARILLRSSEYLSDDDQSAVTFWFEDREVRNKFASAVALSFPPRYGETL